MKIKNTVVTFWFNKYNNLQEMVETLSKELNNYFPAFNFTGLPANVDPVIPRINAQSKSGHSIFNMSTINAQLTTSYDNNYNENFDQCLEYIEERAKRIYQILMYRNEKFFGESENKACDSIIEKTAVQPKNNFFDYYA